jgi:hypothetical protein
MHSGLQSWRHLIGVSTGGSRLRALWVARIRVEHIECRILGSMQVGENFSREPPEAVISLNPF